MPDGAIVTHVITCQDRDHIVTIQSGDCVLVVVNVHVEPNLTLRSLLKDHASSLHIGHVILGRLALTLVTSTSVNRRKEGSTSGTKPSRMVMREKTALFRHFFPDVLEIAQPDFTRKDYAADGIIRTLSRIDRAIITLPMAEARDYHCSSHISDNLGERSIPSDHAAVRVVAQKRAVRCNQVKRIPSWMSKHHVTCSILKQISGDHHYPDDPFVALADFKVILEKAGKWAVHELLRETPGSQGAKLLTSSTALRTYRNRHLGTLMHCFEAWELVGKCIDQCSFECIDFHGLTQMIARLTRERITEREAEIRNLPCPQTADGKRQRFG